VDEHPALVERQMTRPVRFRVTFAIRHASSAAAGIGASVIVMKETENPSEEA